MQETTNVVDLIHQYLEQQVTMQLATIQEGKPRICTVHYAFDDNSTLYWSSSTSSHHSRAIEENEQVAAGILQSADLKQCIHIEGTAHKTAGEEAAKAYEHYTKRFGEDPDRIYKINANAEMKEAYYVLVPERIVLIDAQNFPDSPRQEYVLPKD